MLRNLLFIVPDQRRILEIAPKCSGRREKFLPIVNNGDPKFSTYYLS